VILEGIVSVIIISIWNRLPCSAKVQMTVTAVEVVPGELFVNILIRDGMVDLIASWYRALIVH
jgi:hypothetical protein